MRKINLVVALFCALPHLTFASLGLELIPKGRPFRMTFTDPREIRMTLSFEGSNKINASVGNYFSLLGIRPAENSAWLFHVGLEGAGFFTMRQMDSRFPLETADGLIGFYTETSTGPWQFQIRYTHISAHLADGSSGTSIAYSRETLSQRVGYIPWNDLHLYSGIHYTANTVPKLNPWAIQFGGSYFLPLGGTKLVPYTGADVKYRAESSYNPSLSLQLGIAFGNPPEAYKSFRFFYAYYTGADPRGQFYNHVVTSHSLGIEMQI